MRTFACRCGNDIEIIPPSPHAGYMVLDSDVDLSIDNRTATIRSFLNAVHNRTRGEWLADFYGKNPPLSRLAEKDDADVIEDILSTHDSWTRHVFRCPICGHMYIQRQPGADDFQCYDEESS
jgi:hypothetical protein